MVDAPRALPLSPQLGWGCWALLSSEGRPHANLLPAPRGLVTGPLLIGEQLAPSRSLLGPASQACAQVPGLSLG